MRPICLLVVILTMAGSTAPAGETTRVSVDSVGTEGDDQSQCPAFSADGRYVVFGSWAATLVPDDTNGTFDIFVHDRQTATTERVNLASDGSEGNATSYASNDFGPDISADGRYVAFYSYADNLVADDTNGVGDIFVRDRLLATTVRVSVASDGSQSDGYSFEPSISADGRFVVYQSFAGNLVADDTNNFGDIYVHDRSTGSTQRVSVASDGSEGNDNSYNGRPSGDGRLVVFSSLADNLVPGDTNLDRDVFVRDRQTGTTERVSVASDGSEANDRSLFPRISESGRFVVFTSPASNLAAGDTNALEDIFTHDRTTGVTERVSVSSAGGQSDGRSLFAGVSSDGLVVGFHSLAANLVGSDTNAEWDVFAHEPRVAIFRDGFESGDTTAWSTTTLGGWVPGPQFRSCDIATAELRTWHRLAPFRNGLVNQNHRLILLWQSAEI